MDEGNVVRKVSKFGQNLDEIGEVLENGLVKGTYSKRTFDPNKVGGKILDLDFSNVNIKTSGIDDIKTHLKRLDPAAFPVFRKTKLETYFVRALAKLHSELLKTDLQGIMEKEAEQSALYNLNKPRERLFNDVINQ